MDKFKANIVKEVQELQRLGACRNHNAVERIIAKDLSDYVDMSVLDATTLLLEEITIDDEMFARERAFERKF